MASYAHAVRPMSRLEAATAERYRVTCKAHRAPGTPGCPREPTHLASYESTGPEGRANRTTLRVCTEHAQSFAERHKLRIPQILPEIL